MKIYTKTGDDGTTGLQGDIRISKTHPRIIAYGTIDEANASLGIVLSYDLDSDITNILHKIQNELFIAGADLSNSNLDQTENRVSASMTDSIEQAIDQFEKELSPLTVVRRAEIHIVSLKENEKINEDCLKYINRLSDLLFVLGRVINKRKGKQDIIWKP